jgi:hypothetical protein
MSHHTHEKIISQDWQGGMPNDGVMVTLTKTRSHFLEKKSALYVDITTIFEL